MIPLFSNRSSSEQERGGRVRERCKETENQMSVTVQLLMTLNLATFSKSGVIFPRIKNIVIIQYDVKEIRFKRRIMIPALHFLSRLHTSRGKKEYWLAGLNETLRYKVCSPDQQSAENMLWLWASPTWKGWSWKIGWYSLVKHTPLSAPLSK